MKDHCRQEEFSCLRDELVIRGTRYLPDKPGPYPPAVLSHGLMVSRNSMRKYAAFLASCGCAAYIFDFCGGSINGKSDGETTDMSVLTEVEDLKAVIAYVQGEPDVIPEHLILMGCSQGGFVSALAAAGLGDAVHALILFYPAFCMPDAARDGRMMYASFDPEDVPETFSCGSMKLGRRFAADLMEMNALEEIEPYKGPVLLVHGEDDELVDPDYSFRAYMMYALDRELPQEELGIVLIRGAGHGFEGRSDRTALRAVKRFLKKTVS